jgi:hypothetical protein
MLPVYLEGALKKEMDTNKIDLQGLTVMISTYEHLDHQTMLTTMHSIIATLDMTVGGAKSAREVRDILEAYLLVYAFGVNIDLTNLQDIRDNKTNLELNHPAWRSLAKFIWDVKTQMFPKPELEFGELAQVILAFGDRYPQWQEEDCTRARNHLVGLPSYRNGSVLLSDLNVSKAEGRRNLFEEPADFVMGLGVVTGKADFDHSRFIVPNYLSSLSMCLSTASYHSVCCENTCEALYAQLERGIGAPVAKVEQISDLVTSMPGKQPVMWKDLKGIANKKGEIKLHSRSFAKWMHHAFPLDCPLPVLAGQYIHPKTPDEWMDSAEDHDAPLALFADLLKQISTVWDMWMGTAMGERFNKFNNRQSSPQAEPAGQTRDVILVVSRTEVTKDEKSPFQWYFLALIPSAFFAIATVFQTVKYGSRCLATSSDDPFDNALKGI